MITSSNKEVALAIRLTREEKVLLKMLVKEAQRQRPYISASDVYRELLGLTYTGMVTDEMRREFRMQIQRLGRPAGEQQQSEPEIELPF